MLTREPQNRRPVAGYEQGVFGREAQVVSIRIGTEGLSPSLATIQARHGIDIGVYP